MSSAVLEQLRTRARAANATIVLPEGDDGRVVEAAAILAAEGIARPILIGDRVDVRAAAARVPVDLPAAVDVLDPRNEAVHERLLPALRGLPAFAPLSDEEARGCLADPMLLGALLVRTGEADGCVGGAVRPSRDVLRAALRVVGLEDGVQSVSGAFLMILSDGRPLTFADCAVIPEPDALQLGEIAVRSARTHYQLTGQAPVVAMLSFSTKGSAEYRSVARVREATDRARAMAPDLVIDGELQFDAAWVTEIGRRKAAGSPVTGRANVFVFPTLDAANIAYKITEQLASARAIGPFLQGLSRPMHDLSRGCGVDDIVDVAAGCAVQAGSRMPSNQRD
jgi:phosphate acetyltransferase